MQKIEAVNDFVLRFANVNGTGSASANNLFSKVVFRMGVPVSAKNIFPSNIQGLPTWYEVRINEQGHLGRRGGVDFMVAINGQTMQQDYSELLPGGYLLYDSSKPLGAEFNRTDIHEIGIPLTDITNSNYQDPRLRQIFKNIIYVGALCSLFDMDYAVLEATIRQMFAKKPKLIEPNLEALGMGREYAATHFPDTCKLRIRSSDRTRDQILIEGNTATALGAIYAGATVAAWYPITPSTSVVEAFEKYARKLRVDGDSGKNRFAIIQAEDELAAIGMVVGAMWNGARSFTSTSGPGISLMGEFLGLAYFAEVPALVVDVQRVGPSTGMPTRTQQSDLISAAYASHGDTKHVLLLPSDPAECFGMMADGFDLTERLQTPVIVMTDLDLGMNLHTSPPLAWNDARVYDRGKVLSAEDLDALQSRWGRYLDEDNDGISPRTIPGTHPTKGSYFTRGSSHDEYAAYTEDGNAYARNMEKLKRKWNTARTLMPAPDQIVHDAAAEVAMLYFGTSAHACHEALAALASEGVVMNALRVKSFPFHADVEEFINKHRHVFVIEQNRDGQMRTLLINECGFNPSKLVSVLNTDGMPLTAQFVMDHIKHHWPALQSKSLKLAD